MNPSILSPRLAFASHLQRECCGFIPKLRAKKTTLALRVEFPRDLRQELYKEIVSCVGQNSMYIPDHNHITSNVAKACVPFREQNPIKVRVVVAGISVEISGMPYCPNQYANTNLLRLLSSVFPFEKGLFLFFRNIFSQN